MEKGGGYSYLPGFKALVNSARYGGAPRRARDSSAAKPSSPLLLDHTLLARVLHHNTRAAALCMLGALFTLDGSRGALTCYTAFSSGSSCERALRLLDFRRPTRFATRSRTQIDYSYIRIRRASGVEGSSEVRSEISQSSPGALPKSWLRRDDELFKNIDVSRLIRASKVGHANFRSATHTHFGRESSLPLIETRPRRDIPSNRPQPLDSDPRITFQNENGRPTPCG